MYKQQEYFRPVGPVGWYEPDDYIPDHHCQKCEDKDYKLCNAAHFLEGIIEMLYSKEPLKVLDLERCLDELCNYLDVKLIPGDLQIERLKEKVNFLPLDYKRPVNEPKTIEHEETT